MDSVGLHRTPLTEYRVIPSHCVKKSTRYHALPKRIESQRGIFSEQSQPTDKRKARTAFLNSTSFIIGRGPELNDKTAQGIKAHFLRTATFMATLKHIA